MESVVLGGGAALDAQQRPFPIDVAPDLGGGTDGMLGGEIGADPGRLEVLLFPVLKDVGWGQAQSHGPVFPVDPGPWTLDGGRCRRCP